MTWNHLSLFTVVLIPLYVSPEDELPQPSSPSLKKSEEKGIVVVHEVKCKLYVKVYANENLYKVIHVGTAF